MPDQTPAPRSLRVVTITLAVACGATVANLYYAQPLLNDLARSFGTSDGTTALVVTATQLGYAAGLLLLLPLADLLENRRLGSVLLGVTAAGLVAAALSPNLPAFVVCSVLVGVTSVVAQILVPLATYFAPEERRGQVVGQVMSGLIVGILLARTVSAFVSELLGWRAIFWLSAVLMIGIAGLLRVVLPTRTPRADAGYPELLRSVASLVRREPELRRRALAQALTFGTFSVFWTVVAYRLGAEFGMGQIGIGLFALVGAAGALAAPFAGRTADRGHGRLGRGIMLALSCAAMVAAGVSGHHLVLLAAAAVVLDLATQGHQVLGQQVIYGLDPDARARINSVYMTTSFLGGAAASALSGWLYENYGWGAACTAGAVLAGFGAACWLGSSVRHRSITIPPRRATPAVTSASV